MLIVTLAILIGLLALAVPVAAGLGILGLSLSAIYSKLPLSRAMGEVAWSTSNDFLLVASRSSCCSARSCCARASPSACMTRWWCGCRGCRAG